MSVLQQVCRVSAPVSDSSAAPEATSIAIVGGGPRGLYCLQSLAHHLQTLRTPSGRLATPVRITLFEPAAFPGAGTVYDPRQPRYLRMNFAARHIDAWPRDTELNTPYDQERLNLLQWMRTHGIADVGPHDFVARAIVGEYLHDCYQTTARRLQDCASFALQSLRVRSVRRHRDRWRVTTDADTYEFDEVAFTVGHEGWRRSSGNSSQNRILPVFPVQKRLDEDHVPAGSTVAVRGFGLTFIDAALALTEGRGGTFEDRGSHWRYDRAAAEPRCILPLSRTGRPMLAKPDGTKVRHEETLHPTWARYHAQVLSLSRPLNKPGVVQKLWKIMHRAAADAINQANSSTAHQVSASSVEQWFEHWTSGGMSYPVTLRTMRQSYAVATGRAHPDIAWGLGAAWRNLYPALVEIVSHRGLTEDAWPTFRRVAVEMERIAFGPPAENLGRVLALIDAGLIDLRCLSCNTPRETGADGSLPIRGHHFTTASQQPSVDKLIDAVIPAPEDASPEGPLQHLIEQRTIERLPGARGIHVDRAGRPIVAGQVRCNNLAIFGRATEGCVLGNDTLSRTLHLHPRRWAEQIVQKLAKSRD